MHMGYMGEPYSPPLGGVAIVSFAQATTPTKRFVLSTALAEWWLIVDEIMTRTVALFKAEEKKGNISVSAVMLKAGESENGRMEENEVGYVAGESCQKRTDTRLWPD